MGERASTETAYYLSSLVVNAKTMGDRIRSHWSTQLGSAAADDVGKKDDGALVAWPLEVVDERHARHSHRRRKTQLPPARRRRARRQPGVADPREVVHVAGEDEIATLRRRA